MKAYFSSKGFTQILKIKPDTDLPIHPNANHKISKTPSQS